MRAEKIQKLLKCWDVPSDSNWYPHESFSSSRKWNKFLFTARKEIIWTEKMRKLFTLFFFIATISFFVPNFHELKRKKKSELYFERKKFILYFIWLMERKNVVKRKKGSVPHSHFYFFRRVNKIVMKAKIQASFRL
jgi:hypothetical protein